MPPIATKVDVLSCPALLIVAVSLESWGFFSCVGVDQSLKTKPIGLAVSLPAFRWPGPFPPYFYSSKNKCCTLMQVMHLSVCTVERKKKNAAWVQWSTGYSSEIYSVRGSSIRSEHKVGGKRCRSSYFVVALRKNRDTN